jgi:hypothetical protein
MAMIFRPYLTNGFDGLKAMRQPIGYNIHAKKGCSSLTGCGQAYCITIIEFFYINTFLFQHVRDMKEEKKLKNRNRTNKNWIAVGRMEGERKKV